MSQQETHIGKLKLVPKLENETSEEQCKRLCNNAELESYHDDYLDYLKDEYYNTYIVYNDDIYEIIEDDENNGYYDIFNAYNNSDGSISYVLSYYNGGCGFSDAIGYALEDMGDK